MLGYGPIKPAEFSPEACRDRARSVAAMQAHTRVMDPQEVARLVRRRQEEYLLRVAPFTKIMASLMDVQPVKYTVTKEGEEIASFERVVLWDAKSKELYDQAAAMVDAIRREYIPGGEDEPQTAV